MKTCTKCRDVKPFNMFTKCAAKLDGMHIWCKACCKVVDAAQYARKAEKILAARAQDRVDNPEKYRLRDATRRAANPEKIRAQSASYYERFAPQMKAKRQANPQWERAAKAKRRALQDNATLPGTDYDEIANFYDDARTLEKIFGWKFEVDHIVPLNNPLVSGLHVPANLQILSARENRLKSNKFNVEEYIP